jgi:hypothetical protein
MDFQHTHARTSTRAHTHTHTHTLFAVGCELQFRDSTELQHVSTTRRGTLTPLEVYILYKMETLAAQFHGHTVSPHRSNRKRIFPSPNCMLQGHSKIVQYATRTAKPMRVKTAQNSQRSKASNAVLLT